jgi:hypothetical protein
MSSPRLPAERRGRILAAWLDHLEPSALGGDAHLASELEGWLVLFAAALEGDRSAHGDLRRLVAMAARRWCSQGRPASTSVSRLLALEDALFAVLGPDHGLDGPARELVRIAADAHALGQSERERALAERGLIEATPVLSFGESLVAGFLLCSMAPDNLDALMGRLMRMAVGSGASTVLIDVAGAPPDDDRFHRTIAGFLESEVAHGRTLVISGLRDPEATLAALRAQQAPLARLEVAESASAVIAARLDRGA